MPELPEVEVMAQKLHEWVRGREIVDVRVLRQNGKYDVDPIRVRGVTVRECLRRGKKIFFSANYDIVLSVHNAMSGYWDASDDTWTFDYVEGKRESSQKDVRVEIELDNGRVLRFHDQRLFGSIKTVSHDEARHECAKMGPEAIKTDRMYPSVQVLNVLDMTVICNDSRSIKEVLMDQARVAGIGNIYSAEALWMSRIHPETKANLLGTQELAALTEAIQRALTGALERNLVYDDLLIYRKRSCPEGHPVGKLKVGGRSTYFCGVCQERK